MDKILVLAPHTDDAELGCGGFIGKYVNKKEIYIIIFSYAHKVFPIGFNKEDRDKEVKSAMECLGVKPHNITCLDYEGRTFSDHRQEILDYLIKVRDELKPDLVLVPSTYDIHQDHKTISEEAIRAFKATSILGYEMPWNNLTFHTQVFVPLSGRYIQKKMNAIKCYKSMKGRRYMSPTFSWALAKSRGCQIGVEYAETYEAIRWIL
jgi:LmbE family N-acetylglucosaminyl deacetylase